MADIKTHPTMDKLKAVNLVYSAEEAAVTWKQKWIVRIARTLSSPEAGGQSMVINWEIEKAKQASAEASQEARQTVYQRL